ncbi:MAG: TlpA family protein disulfide reductase [Muribaculaceae bacterium]|nr:TlpA family protein disulfide reductase [Muribaculaceae bacterium]
MKYFSMALLAILAAGCSQKDDCVVLNCKVQNFGDNQIAYMQSSDGFWQSKSDATVVELTSDSTFTIVTPGAGVQKIKLMVYGKGWTGLYLEPGTYNVTIAPPADDIFTYGEVFKAANVAASEAASLGTKYFWDVAMGKPVLDLKGDTVAVSVERKLAQFADSVAGVIAGADKPLRAAMTTETEYSLARIFHELNSRPRLSRAGVSEAEIARWDSVGRAIDDRIDFNAPAGILTDNLKILSIIRMYDALEHSYGRDSVMAMVNSGSVDLNRLRFEHVKGNYTGLVAEYLLAGVIVDDSEQNKFSESLGDLYDEFVAIYPDSKLLGDVDKAMDENRRANAIDGVEGITFIETDSFESLVDLIASYKGQPLMVDVWATWCGPCRRSFSHAPEVQACAAENGIKLLYVSIDQRDTDKVLARKLARYYDLKGDHIVADSAMYAESFNLFGRDGYISIPVVAVYDSEGNRLTDIDINAEDVTSVLSALNHVK